MLIEKPTTFQCISQNDHKISALQAPPSLNDRGTLPTCVAGVEIRGPILPVRPLMGLNPNEMTQFIQSQHKYALRCHSKYDASANIILWMITLRTQFLYLCTKSLAHNDRSLLFGMKVVLFCDSTSSGHIDHQCPSCYIVAALTLRLSSAHILRAEFTFHRYNLRLVNRSIKAAVGTVVDN